MIFTLYSAGGATVRALCFDLRDRLVFLAFTGAGCATSNTCVRIAVPFITATRICEGVCDGASKTFRSTVVPFITSTGVGAGAATGFAATCLFVTFRCFDCVVGAPLAEPRRTNPVRTAAATRIPAWVEGMVLPPSGPSIGGSFARVNICAFA